MRYLPLVLLILVSFGCSSAPSHEPIDVAPTADAKPFAPDIEVESLSNPGTMASPADFKGKVVALDFWATWCGPCREVMPVLEDLQEQYGDRIVIMSITDEDRKTVEEFVKDEGATYPVYLDPENKFAQELKFDGIPTVAVIDTEGKMAFYSVGFDKQGFLRAIESAMK